MNPYFRAALRHPIDGVGYKIQRIAFSTSSCALRSKRSFKRAKEAISGVPIKKVLRSHLPDRIGLKTIRTKVSDWQRPDINKEFDDRFDLSPELEKFGSVLAQHTRQFLHRCIEEYPVNPTTNRAMRDLMHGISAGLRLLEVKPRDVVLEDVLAPDMHSVVGIIYSLSIDIPEWAEAILNKKDVYTFFLEKMFAFYLKLNQHGAPPAKKTLDFGNPLRWFPKARALRRKIVVHVGPTNSGKTHNALETLRKAGSGFYAAPLRLLAREVYDRFMLEGVTCNLMTGEDVIENTDSLGSRARHLLGTIEMFPILEMLDVVVLDEIQMILDPDRGWAWTQAFLGACAHEVHVCGEDRAVPLLQKLVKLTGDNIIVHRYQRLGELHVEKNPVDLCDLEEGDCVVAFSKAKVLSLKLRIEEETGLRVAAVYGALPPETRKDQAALFNDGRAQILVATDAIGMGLNLGIRRVVFLNTLKFDGRNNRPLSASETRQIGGRAGRFREGVRGVGYITALDRRNLKRVKIAMNTSPEPLNRACLWPSDGVWEALAAQFSTHTPLKDVLAVYAAEVRTLSLFFSANTETYEMVAEILDRFQRKAAREGRPTLLLKDQLTLLKSPFKAVSDKITQLFFRAISEGQTVTPFELGMPMHVLANLEENPGFREDEKRERFVQFEGKVVARETGNPSYWQQLEKERLDALQELETTYNLLTFFGWLGYRYPVTFAGREQSEALKLLCEYKILEILWGSKQMKVQYYSHTARREGLELSG